jgi:hypothetical protein
MSSFARQTSSQTSAVPVIGTGGWASLVMGLHVQPAGLPHEQLKRPSFVTLERLDGLCPNPGLNVRRPIGQRLTVLRSPQSPTPRPHHRHAQCAYAHSAEKPSRLIRICRA